MIYVLNGLINGCFIFYFLSILINQYYSLSRFMRVSYLILKKNIVVFLLLGLSSFSILINKYIPYFFSLIFLIIFLINNTIIKFKFTRRSLILFVLSVLISIWFIPNIIFFPFISLIGGYLLTYPFELIIRNKYFKSAREKLERINPIIIGITGSYGKTSFKYLLVEILKTGYIVSSPLGNINTPNGISKFINNELKDETEILVLELGIDQLNGMDVFKKFISLDIGVITSIGENHLANFKSLDNTLKAKLKIKGLLKDNGKLYLNSDSTYLSEIKKEENIIKFSKSNMGKALLNHNGISVTFNNQNIIIPLYGEYVYSYIDGIIKISEFLGINKDLITTGLKQIKPLNRRLEVRKYKNGYFINDSYNVNLKGVEESLKLLSVFKGENVVITGGITEQGKLFNKQNEKYKKLLKNRNVIFIGSSKHPLVEEHQFKSLYIVHSLNEAYTLVDELSFTNVLLLAKGEDLYLR